MAKVYVVIGDIDCGDDADMLSDTLGVFDTKEGAEDFIDKYEVEGTNNTRYCDYRAEEWELNKEIM